MKVVKIIHRGYIARFNKYVVWAMLYQNGNYRYERLFFSDKDKFDKVQEGTIIK